MRSRFDEQLADLNKKLIEMGAMCEECISLAAKALKEGNPGIRWEVEPLDNSLDDLERNVESLCLKLLLQHCMRMRSYFFARYLRISMATATMMTRPWTI